MPRITADIISYSGDELKHRSRKRQNLLKYQVHFRSHINLKVVRSVTKNSISLYIAGFDGHMLNARDVPQGRIER